MSPGDWIALVGIGLTALGAAVGYGMLRQRVSDIEKARGEDVKRIERAEQGANAVQGLAAAVEHLGERVGDQMKHLVETFGLKFEHLTGEMADLKAEVRRRRLPAARPKATRAEP